MAGSPMPLFAVCCLATLLFHAEHGMAYERSLLAEQVVPKCNWNPNSECSVNPSAVLSVPATDEASNLARKFAAAYAKCPSITSEEQCKQPTTDGVHCAWSSTTSKCTTINVDTEYLLPCPDSKVAKILQCLGTANCTSPCVAVNFTSAMPASQNKNTGRHLLSPSNQASASGARTPIFTSSMSMGATRGGDTAQTLCMPSGMSDAATIQGYETSAYDQTTRLLNTAWWGTCETVTLANKIIAADATCANYTTNATCQGARNCLWQASTIQSPSGACESRDDSELVVLADSSSGTFASTVQAMYKACHDAATEDACTGVGTAKYDDTAIASALAYTPKANGAWATAASTLQIMLAALAAMVLAVAV